MEPALDRTCLRVKTENVSIELLFATAKTTVVTVRYWLLELRTVRKIWQHMYGHGGLDPP